MIKKTVICDICRAMEVMDQETRVPEGWKVIHVYTPDDPRPIYPRPARFDDYCVCPKHCGVSFAFVWDEPPKIFDHAAMMESED